MENGGMAAGGRGKKVSALDGAAPESTDYANYFCTYSYLYHQKDMLEDHKRTGAYYNACIQNRAQFDGKVVLDVGTGSGILAIFAAKAGARKVYAVEATSMAANAKRLVASAGLEGVVEVIQGVIESVDIPEKVDIIISEWMGYFLLRESMLDSVLVARDKFLAPGGALFPSHARMFLAPIRTNASHQRAAEFQRAMEGWGEFNEDMKQFYGVDMACLTDSFSAEQKEYYHQATSWADVHPSQMIGPPTLFQSFDLLTVSVEELKAPLKAPFSMSVLEGGPVDAFAGFFDTQFKGSPANPTDFPINLSTAPDPTGATHWGQQVFYLLPPVECAAGDKIEGEIEVVRRRDNHRLMEVTIRHKVVGGSAAAAAAVERVSKFNIE